MFVDQGLIYKGTIIPIPLIIIKLIDSTTNNDSISSSGCFIRLIGRDRLSNMWLGVCISPVSVLHKQRNIVTQWRIFLLNLLNRARIRAKKLGNLYDIAIMLPTFHRFGIHKDVPC